MFRPLHCDSIAINKIAARFTAHCFDYYHVSPLHSHGLGTVIIRTNLGAHNGRIRVSRCIRHLQPANFGDSCPAFFQHSGQALWLFTSASRILLRAAVTLAHLSAAIGTLYLRCGVEQWPPLFKVVAFPMFCVRSGDRTRIIHRRWFPTPSWPAPMYALSS